MAELALEPAPAELPLLGCESEEEEEEEDDDDDWPPPGARGDGLVELLPIEKVEEIEKIFANYMFIVIFVATTFTAK